MTPSVDMPRRRIITALVALAGLALGSLFASVVIALCSRVETQASHGQTGLLYSLASDPTAGGGIAAPQWQLLVRTDVPGIYYKSGTANTAWTLLGSSSAGTGTVTSVGCGTNMACTPSPIVGAGTVATVAAPTFAGTVTGGAFTTAGDVTAATGIVTGAQVVAAGLASLQSALVGDVTHDGLLTFEIAAASGPTVRPFAGDPSGTIAVDGSIALDTGGNVWVKHGGAGVWKKLAESGGGSAFYDAVFTKSFVGGGTGTLQIDDVDMSSGAGLGQNTLVWLNCQNAGFNCRVSGMTGGVAGKIITLCDDGTSVVNLATQFLHDDAGSVAANRLENRGNTTTNASARICTTYRWGAIGAGAARWQMTTGNAL